ncbi:hypothetical protein RFI_17252 [Reticulomyxa filosa]|uniref:TRAF-type domain-containing protein n=1 Tax=Reticulomyxa filosa TaxID=46433 RepID=X6N2L5_RETFI|nr:hypothetical protein RFI_17252 [Reticulomyxa filosa]|eukprot:ETO19969.1 hypothetical protein RFI_17252 [Reticulomyxa filosa]
MTTEGPSSQKFFLYFVFPLWSPFLGHSTCVLNSTTTKSYACLTLKFLHLGFILINVPKIEITNYFTYGRKLSLKAQKVGKETIYLFIDAKKVLQRHQKRARDSVKNLENKNEDDNTDATTLSKNCYDRKLLLCNEGRQLASCVCLLCHQVASNAVELICSEHQDHTEPLVVGEACLKQYLKDNKGNCPTQVHEGCQYMNSKFVRRIIDELMILCPRQYEQNVQRNGGSKTKDGATPSTPTCTFQGKIKDLKEHLEHSCSLQKIECTFKKYGCDTDFFLFRSRTARTNTCARPLGYGHQIYSFPGTTTPAI